MKVRLVPGAETSGQVSKQAATTANPAAVDLSHGRDKIAFKVRLDDGTTADRELDVLELKLLCEQCEQDNHLATSDGRFVATPDFLRDLAKRLEPLGLPNLTPSLAWTVWITATERIGQLKN